MRLLYKLNIFFILTSLFVLSVLVILPVRENAEICVRVEQGERFESEPIEIFKGSTKDRYTPFIEICSKKYNLEKELIFAVIFVESRWDSNAVSSANAIGLMQIRDGERDPKKNINSGCAILRNYIKRFDGNIAMGLTAYHRGYTGAKRLGHPSRYARKVLRKYEKYRSVK